MSLFFYKKPEYIEKDGGPLNYVTVHKYAEKAASCKTCIPDRLSFDNVLNGKTMPPCSLTDFMDYLVYIARDAENLQFLLWLRDYSKRFHQLSSSEAALSPPDGRVATESRGILPGPIASEKPSAGSNLREVTSKNSFDSQRNTQAQPFRAEINLVIQHYLTQGSPRELNLSFRIRSSVIEALQRTTHPSAFGPVRDLTEQCLRNQSHPNFIRWAVINRRGPRGIILKELTATVFLLFLAGEIALILSRYTRWLRLTLTPLLLVAIIFMHAVVHGFCVLLVLSNHRELQPWELFAEDEEAVAPFDPSKFRGEGGRGRDGSSSLDEIWTAAHKARSLSSSARTASDAASNTTRSTSTLKSRVSRMNPFGAGNAFDQEMWVSRWNRLAWWKKSMWSFTVGRIPSQEDGIREIHRTLLLSSICWAVLIATPVLIIVVVLPVCGLY